MAAARSVSAMVRLFRRSCVSGSSAAAPMGGGLMEIPLVRPTAPGTPPLRHSAVGNLKNLQRFSTGKACADPKKSPLMKDNVLNMLGRWSKDSLRNVKEVEPAKALCVCTLITGVTSLYFTATIIWSMKQSVDADSYGEF